MRAKRPERVGWHSVVEVQPNQPQDDWPQNAAGAFVHVLALAFSSSDFKERVAAEFCGEGFNVVGWAEVNSFDEAVNDWDTEEAAELHEHLSLEFPVQYSGFNTYPKEGLDA